ncbi:MAG: glycosyltransferase family 9 protein [Marmoricola sp.]
MRPLGGEPPVPVLRALGLGDLLAGVPALRALAAALPERRLLLLAPAVLTPLVRLAGLPVAIHDLDAVRGLPDRLDGVPPTDLAVNLHGRGPQSHRLLREVAAHQVAYGNSAAGVDGPVWRAHEHERERWCRLVSTCLEVDADPDDLRLAVPDQPPLVPGAFVVHPGAASGARRWPAPRWAQVVAAAAAAGHDVVVTGSAAERPLAEQVAAGRARVLAGETDLVQLAALVAGATRVVCGDTGIGHLAAAYAVPSVHLFGPTAPTAWGPPEGRCHRVLWRPADDDPVPDPLGERLDPALGRITVPEVLEGLALPALADRA